LGRTRKFNKGAAFILSGRSYEADLFEKYNLSTNVIFITLLIFLFGGGVYIRSSNEKLRNNSLVQFSLTLKLKNMKKLFLLSFFVISVFSLTASKANSVDLKNNASTMSIPSENEDGIRCKVYNDDGDLIASCWFCNCGALAAGARIK
jgi:hypothetical protein